MGDLVAVEGSGIRVVADPGVFPLEDEMKIPAAAAAAAVGSDGVSVSGSSVLYDWYEEACVAYANSLKIIGKRTRGVGVLPARKKIAKVWIRVLTQICRTCLSFVRDRRNVMKTFGSRLS
jgi:hypothetical protein